MSRQSAPYARRSVWWVIAVLSVLLVAGFVAAGYEINHLRTQVNGLQTQTNGLQYQLAQLGKEVSSLYQVLLKSAGH